MRKKRIGIDIQSMMGEKSGLGVYTQNLYEEIGSLNCKYNLISIRSFLKGNLTTPKRLIYDQLEKPIKAYFNNLDLLHVPAFSAPFLYARKKIISCHDLIPILFNPPAKSKLGIFYWKTVIYESMKNCDFIITSSDFTKQDLINNLNIPEKKIQRVYLGVESMYKPKDKFKKENLAETKRKYNLPDKFILYVGNVEERKNIPRLIKSAENLKVPLVIVGKVWTQIDADKNVIFTGYISDLDKAIIYSIATVFVMPSLYEGFCFPIVEAMKAGVPVISSNRTCLPEIGADACLYFDPEDTEDMTDKIKLGLENYNIRNDLIKKGLENSKRFNWKDTAKETLNIYDKLLQ